MVTTQRLSGEQQREMLETLASLTPAERQTLEDPDFITEDEADIIICDRRLKEDGPPIPFEKALADLGIALPRLGQRA